MLGSFSLEAFNQPDLDDRLPGYTNASRFTIQRFDNPGREVDIDTLLLLIDTPSRRQVKIINDVLFSFIEFLVKVFGF